jgi:SPW repeat
MEEWSRAKLCDVTNLFLGAILFFSPWVFSLSPGAPRETASIIGLLIAVLSIAALAAFAIWEEWFNLIAGLWLIVVPWLLGFQDRNAMIIDVVIGSLVAALAAFEIWLAVDYRQGGPTDGGMAAQS